MTSKQPYSFSGDAPIKSGLEKLGRVASQPFQAKGRAAEAELQSNLRIRENAINTVLKTRQQKKLIKAQGKQDRKTVAASEIAATEGHKARMKNTVLSAKQLGRFAEPQTSVELTPTSVSFTAPARKSSVQTESFAPYLSKGPSTPGKNV